MERSALKPLLSLFPSDHCPPVKLKLSINQLFVAMWQLQTPQLQEPHSHTHTHSNHSQKSQKGHSNRMISCLFIPILKKVTNAYTQ